MSILETPIQQKVASEEVHRDLGKLSKVNSFRSKQAYTSMIIKNLKIFSQNIWKNSIIITTILESLTHYNIILI